jgi:hypothetical protein
MPRNESCISDIRRVGLLETLPRHRVGGSPDMSNGMIGYAP